MWLAHAPTAHAPISPLRSSGFYGLRLVSVVCPVCVLWWQIWLQAEPTRIYACLPTTEALLQLASLGRDYPHVRQQGWHKSGTPESSHRAQMGPAASR